MSKKFEEGMRLLESGVKNIIQSASDAFCEKNTELRTKAGLKVQIIRETLGECCDWCSDLAGTYTYDNMPEDLYARHLNCSCCVSTRTEKGTYQDAWSKKEYNTYRENRLARENEILQERVQTMREQAENYNKMLREAEKSHRRTIYRNTEINRSKIESPDYGRRLSSLGENQKVQSEIKKQAKDMLNHRSGTKFEDLSFIDSKTGRALTQKNFNVENAVNPTKNMKKMLKESEPNSIIAIHNHAGSTMPSVADIKVCAEKEYKYGIVVGHDGSIYKYYVNEKNVNFGAYDMAWKKIYNNRVDYNLSDFLKDVRRVGINVEIL